MTSKPEENTANRDVEACGPVVPDIVLKGDMVGARVEQFQCDVEAILASGEVRLVVDVSGVGCFDEEACLYLCRTAEELSRGGGWLKLLGGGPRPRLIDPLQVEAFTGEEPDWSVECEMEELVTV